MSDRPENFSNTFHAFDDQVLNKPQSVLKKLGIIAYSASAMAQLILIALQGFMKIDTENSPVYISVLIGMFTGGFLVGSLAFTIVAVYYLGRKSGRTTFFTSLLHVLGKVFKYLFLPAIIVTAIMLLPFLIFGWR